MRWVIVFLLFLSAFLFAYGASVSRINELKETNSSLSSADGQKLGECNCGKNGECSLDSGKKMCTCNEGFKEKEGTCQDVCEPNPCENGGTCEKDADGFKCTCNGNWIGKKCEENVCDPNPCENGGTCEKDADGFKCTCNGNWIGKKCEENVCDPNPCENGGTCEKDADGFKCTCNGNWIGKKCEENDGKENVCDNKKPCQNGGTCLPEDGNSYKCDCMTGFKGTYCEIIQWCQENKQICGNISCKYDEEVGSAFCSCEDNLYFDVKSKKCEELDKCLLARMKGNCSGVHETCDTMGNCKCEENYAYNDDQTVCEPDFCQKKSNKPRCGANMECIEGDQSYSCSCKKNFLQIGTNCVEAPKCAPGISKCEQICFINGTCSCFPGFSLSEDNSSCDITDTHTECELNCGKGVCVKNGSTEMCICPKISHVRKDNTCVDKCKAGKLEKDECPEEMGCLSDEEHGYKCNCTGKYDYAEDDVHCKAKRMCSEGGGDEECFLKGGICEDNFALTTGYKCNCKFGYKENQKTHECEHMCKTADCDKKQALCSINVNNRVECICPPLLVKDTNGSCSQLAKYSYIGDFSVPKRNYEVITGIDSGRKKRDTFKDINYAKILKDFEDSMNKIFDDYKGTSILNCTDEEEDWKCFLEIKLDKNPKGKLNIISTPSVCLPLSEPSYCLIPPVFITRKRTADDAQAFHQTNPCDKGVIGKFCGIETECTVSKPGFSCKCKPGYFRRTNFVPAKNIQVEVCEDVDECLNPTICPSTTTCLNLPGDYNCNCKNGYRLEEGESVKIDGCRAVCEPNPCVHGTCFESGKDGFSCSCEELYTGRFCNQTNEAIIGAKKKGIVTSAIVGGVLGAFLVMAIIICIILFRKVQKSKSIDDKEEYMRQRNRGLASDMWKLGRRQPENKDIELRENERRPNLENEDLKYNPQLRINPIDSLSIPRPQMGRSIDKGANNGRERHEIRESGDYRRVYSDDDKMFPKPHSSRQSGEETRLSDYRQVLPRRPLSWSSDAVQE